MPQQQQSNMVQPQKVGGPKKGMGMKMPMKKMKKKASRMAKEPSFAQVQKSVKKSMGY